jgi:hypothetical protein
MNIWGVEVWHHHSSRRHQIEESGNLHAPVASPKENFPSYHFYRRARGSVVVKALCYMPEDCVFEIR